MDLGEFNNAKGILQLLVPASVVLVCISVRDFLAVRALGLLGLMVAAPLLGAAFLKEPTSRLLVPIFAYAMLTASLFCVGMPYLFRDAVSWVSADQKRWTLFSLAGLAYGVATFVCAFAFWRGY
jgi:Na+-transporting NADH:ubiquinone oxidoreductase subunit NqrB